MPTLIVRLFRGRHTELNRSPPTTQTGGGALPAAAGTAASDRSVHCAPHGPLW